jgi:hypothetical protein
MKIKAEYKNETVYIIAFATGSGNYGFPREKAIVMYEFGCIKSVDLWELTIIDTEYVK